MNNSKQRKFSIRPKGTINKSQNGNTGEKKDFTMPIPDSLPFIESLESRLNKKIHRGNEGVLLANYEKHWILRNSLGGISGKEEKYLKYLAEKHNSFILNQI